MNAMLAVCGDCLLWTCADGDVIGETMTRTSVCADDDYTDALAAYNARVEAHADWVIAHAAFPALHATWVTNKATWDACVVTPPCEDCGDEPIEPVDPTEPDAPGTEPVMPDGYGDVTHSCYAPFAEPSGDPGDEIPTLYRTLRDIGGTTYSGTGWSYLSGAGTFPLSAEFLTIGTFTDWTGVGDVGAVLDHTGNIRDSVEETCTPDTTTGAPDFEFPNNDEMYTMGATDPVCTASQRGTETLGTWVSNPTPKALEGCPETGDFDEFADQGWDYTIKVLTGELLESGITKGDLIARAAGKIPATWPDPPEGSGNEASSIADWPVASDLYVGDPGAWPDCDSLTDLPHGYPAEAETTAWRYKVGIPLFMQAHRLWIIAHAAWVIAQARWVSCGSVGDAPAEPPEPQIYHYFARQWDIVRFPRVWDAWRILFDAWTDAVAAHAAWVIAHAAWVLAGSDPETEPEEPIVPADPSADQPDERPEIIDENLFFEWTGGEDLEDQYEAEWHEHEAPSDESRIRMVNVMTKCMQDEARGVPPTFHGETYDPDDYPA